jgi:hypothetical protein
MAFTLKFLDENGFSSTYIDEPDSFLVFAAARNGDKGAIAQVMNLPNFIAEATVTTDTSDGEIVDLTQEGVTFPADTIRTIRCRSYCSTDNDHYAYEWEQKVLGGTTPVLMRQYILNGWGDEAGTKLDYGPNVQFKATTLTGTTITEVVAANGITLAAFSTGAADLALPKNRLCLVNTCMLNDVVSATGANADILTVLTHSGLGTGTDAVVAVDVSGTTDAAVATLVAGTITLAFELWPPFNHRLVMDSNNVTLKATAVNSTIADDVLRHRCEIFVGRLTRLTHHS